MNPTSTANSTALASDLARQGKLEIIDLFTAAEQLIAAGQRDQAITLYRLWLEHTASPLAYAVLFNLGVALGDTPNPAGAEEAYRQAIKLKPDFVQAHLNLGSQFERQGRIDDALAQWRGLVEPDCFNASADNALYLHALNNLGRLLEKNKQYRDAERMLEKSLMLDKQQPNVIQHWVHLRQKQCVWPVYCHLDGISHDDMVSATSPLAMLGLTDDPQLQLAAAHKFVAQRVQPQTVRLSDTPGYAHRKLRIGYFSSDFCLHPVSLLTVQLFELHDRNKVEVYGFCWSPEDGTALRRRVITALDHYVQIGDMNDETAARCIRSHEIDILVDLQGLTSGARPNVLSYRPAPVQITYLGYPGTSALPFMDYVIADRFVLPDELLPFFTEKPLYLPNTFQVSDRDREIGPAPTRAAYGLPENTFVFCSFNNNYKFTPAMFVTWLRIMQRVPDSVLWLLADNPWAQGNLREMAEQFGVAPARLIFASRVSPPDYLARYQLADLFLDTFPFNAGTTANDALWMGLPLLTRAGRTFASRMAGSLLRAAGLPELITSSQEEYEEKAVNLANHPDEIATLKRRLAENRQTFPLFDTQQIVRDLEKRYEEIACRPDMESEIRA